jgi:hypothetical protein
MAIQIQQNLTATPNPTTLPKRLTFQQTLVSDRDSEPIAVVYSLDPAHDVWFEDASGHRTKTIHRADTASQTPKVYRDQITLQRGPGQGPMALVQVDQTVTDSTGVPLADVCTLRFS